jgi:hypothetical protein
MFLDHEFTDHTNQIFLHHYLKLEVRHHKLKYILDVSEVKYNIDFEEKSFPKMQNRTHYYLSMLFKVF